MDSQTQSDRLQTEHRILKYVRTAFELALSVPIGREPFPQWLDRVRFLACSFSRHLGRVFSIEEEEEYHTLFHVDSQRSFTSRVARLQGEHRPILDELDAIVDDCSQAGCLYAPDLFDYRQRAHDWLDRLDRHQSQKNDLWLEAVMVEIGVGD